MSAGGIEILEVSDADRGVYRCEAEQIDKTQTHDIYYDVVGKCCMDNARL